MSWRIAKSLNKLLAQLNASFPNRSKVSDGAIGDADHASRGSDHNPWVKDSRGVGIVTARDFTFDDNPADGVGINGEWLANALVASRDPRIKYVIWNRRIVSSKQQPWQWRPYTGKNAHQHHVHVSVMPDEALFDDESEWNLNEAARGPVTTDSAPPASTQFIPAAQNYNLKKGDRGGAVRALQTALFRQDFLLEKDVDGDFGPKTHNAVMTFQASKGLRADGIVGNLTAQALGLLEKK
jgi:hypothetical protein